MEACEEEGEDLMDGVMPEKQIGKLERYCAEVGKEKAMKLKL